MSPAYLLGIFLALPLIAHAGCDSSISPSDKIRDVKAKLACFEAEVANLKQQLLVAQRTTAGPPRISMSGATVDYKKFSVDACKAKATEVISGRGGKITAQGDDWIDYELGNRAVMVNCRDDRTGYVITAGDADPTTMLDFARILRTEIFPE